MSDNAAEDQAQRLLWRPSPTDLTLKADEIHLWLIDANHPGRPVEFYADLLSEAERVRAAKFKFDKDRRLFTVAHAALRSILSQYLQTAPTRLEFTTGPNGKPRLQSGSPGDLRFNLSHSGTSALIAVALKREIGADIELIKKDFAFAEVAEHFFTHREVAALRALPDSLQRQAFYQCWTSKEAFLKAKGTGLSGTLDEVEITLAEEQSVQIHANVAGWCLIELPPIDGYAAAVAIEGAPLPANCYAWSLQRGV